MLGSDVVLQGRLLAELHAAVSAVVRFFSGVPSAVRFEAGLETEADAAVSAHERLLTRVNGAVSLEVGLRLERPLTDRTGVLSQVFA